MVRNLLGVYNLWSMVTHHFGITTISTYMFLWLLQQKKKQKTKQTTKKNSFKRLSLLKFVTIFFFFLMWESWSSILSNEKCHSGTLLMILSFPFFFTMFGNRLWIFFLSFFQNRNKNKRTKILIIVVAPNSRKTIEKNYGTIE